MTGLSLATVVVGYDGSPAADRAIERAAKLVGSAGRVVLVTASPSLKLDLLAEESLLDAPHAEERDDLLRRGQALLRERGIDAETVASDSDAATALAETAAEKGADLILVGAVGTGYVARAILGSTAEAVVRLARCDVLVVR